MSAHPASLADQASFNNATEPMGRRSFESHSFRQHEGDRVSAKENLVRTLDLRPSCDSTEFVRDLQAAFGKVPGSDASAV